MSAVKRAFLSFIAASRTPGSPIDVVSRLCVRPAATCSVFLLLDGVPSTPSTACALFECFCGIMPSSDFLPVSRSDFSP
jgi:hypothetical protein